MLTLSQCIKDFRNANKLKTFNSNQDKSLLKKGSSKIFNILHHRIKCRLKYVKIEVYELFQVTSALKIKAGKLLSWSQSASRCIFGGYFAHI